MAMLISYASVAVHAATHVAGDSIDCELCVPQGNTPAITVGELDHGVRPVLQAHGQAESPHVASERHLFPYQQRAPPLSD